MSTVLNSSKMRDFTIKTEKEDSPVIIQTSPPSYIKDLTGSDEDIVLIYRKIEVENEERSPVKNEVTNISLDLTGNPLEVDLNGGDCTLNVSTVHCVNLWNANEVEYGSLDLKVVRNVINSMQRGSNYIYGLCNGKDGKRMVMLGVQQTDEVLGRTQVFIGDRFKVDDEVNQGLEKMKEEHCENAKSPNNLEPKVNYLIKGTYVIYGHRLSQSPTLLKSKYFGSIICDATWSTFRYTLPQYVDSIKMTLQVITGHESSPMYSRWNQLMLLKNYINLLGKPHLGSVVLSESPKDIRDIISLYDTLINAEVCWGPPLKKENTQIDFDHLRFEIFTDKLWELLIYCHTVDDLKFCLHRLFEELATSKSLNINHPVQDTSFISKVLRELSDGKIAVPTLTTTQSLTCLIELGIEKLKRDYLYILDYCNCLSQEQGVTLWESHNHPQRETKPSTSSLVSKSALRVTMAKPRFTIDPKTTILSLQNSLQKYNCLLSMHVACSVLVLALKFNCSQQNLLDKIKYDLLHNQIKGKLTGNPLFEVKVLLDNDKWKSLNLSKPIALNIKFTSKKGKDTVETIFHHTTKKLFPPSIYDDYNVPNDLENGSEYYYVSKLVRYTKKNSFGKRP